MSAEMLCDLDGVFLHTRSWIKDFKQVLIDNGSTSDRVAEYYCNTETHKVYRSRTMYLINHPEHYERLLGVSDSTATYEAVKDYIENLPKYIFEDAWRFLNRFHTKNLVLLTYGGLKLQELKIDKSNIANYFKDIIITSGGKKSEAVLEFQKTKPLRTDGFFIDDSPHQILNMKQAFPDLKTILVDRWDEFARLDEADFLVKCLDEATDVILESVARQ